jgi:hypothetical protein
MKTILGELVTGGVIAAALAFPVLTAADEDLPDAKLADWKIGDTLRGDDVKADDIEGKVVVIEYWGTR